MRTQGSSTGQRCRTWNRCLGLPISWCTITLERSMFIYEKSMFIHEKSMFIYEQLLLLKHTCMNIHEGSFLFKKRLGHNLRSRFRIKLQAKIHNDCYMFVNKARVFSKE